MNDINDTLIEEFTPVRFWNKDAPEETCIGLVLIDELTCNYYIDYSVSKEKIIGMFESPFWRQPYIALRREDVGYELITEEEYNKALFLLKLKGDTE
jgi:hypothetical protein